MSGVLLGQGALELAKICEGALPPPGLLIGLFVNNFTPDWTSINSDFTECTAGGYAQIGNSPGSWSGAPGSTPPLQRSLPGVTWTFTDDGGGQSVYGYFWVNSNTGTIWAAEVPVGTPYVIPSGGGSIAGFLSLFYPTV